MRKPKFLPKTLLCINESQEGETIEEKLAKMMTEKEPISQVFERIYTDRKDGVMPGYNIRTDRFEVAREAKEKLSKAEKSKIAKADEKLKNEIKKEEKTTEE